LAVYKIKLIDPHTGDLMSDVVTSDIGVVLTVVEKLIQRYHMEITWTWK
jgi:hypothetical protein